MKRTCGRALYARAGWRGEIVIARCVAPLPWWRWLLRRPCVECIAARRRG